MKVNRNTVFLFLLSMASPLVAGNHDYFYYDLGYLGTTHFRVTDVYDINDRGQIVGSSRTESDETGAVVWDNGILTGLYDVDPDVYFIVAQGISNDGIIAGTAWVLEDGELLPGSTVRYKDGAFTHYPLPAPCTDENEGIDAISRNGRFGVGSCNYYDSETNDKYAVFYDLENVTAVTIGVPPGFPYGTESDVSGVNDEGVVAGYLDLPDLGEPSCGFIWSDGEIDVIENTIGGKGSTTNGINNEGTVVGNVASPTLAYMLKAGAMMVLGAFDTYGVNDREQVIGDYIENLSIRHMVLWDHGELFELNDFVPFPESYGRNIRAINNYGWIVGVVDGYSAEQLISWLLVPIYDKGDYDGDGDVDFQDFGKFQECFAAEPYQGPEGGLHVGCSVFDFDDDADLDLTDYAAFQAAFTGPTAPDMNPDGPG